MEMGEDTQQDESGLLTIYAVTRAHAGLYQCSANNGIAPPATADVKLVVQCEFVAFILCQTNVSMFVYNSVNTHVHLLLCCACFLLTDFHVHPVSCSQTGASERTPMEEGSEQRGWHYYSRSNVSGRGNSSCELLLEKKWFTHGLCKPQVRD